MGHEMNRKMSCKFSRDADNQELMTSAEILHRAKHEDLDHDKNVTRCPQLALFWSRNKLEHSRDLNIDCDHWLATRKRHMI